MCNQQSRKTARSISRNIKPQKAVLRFSGDFALPPEISRLMFDAGLSTPASGSGFIRTTVAEWL
jgi:hypothetical protein